LIVADWDPAGYLAFSDQRARPALDLIARIPLKRPRIVYDLGCGPGNSTSLLRTAYPSARIVGIDRSPAMIARARADVSGVEFQSADVALWPSDRQADLVFSNALFQWIPNHLLVLQRILHGMKRDAVLAIQVPDNLAEPSHMAMEAVASQPQWGSRLKRANEARSGIHAPEDYYDALSPDSLQFSIWHTVYYHVLDSHQDIVNMFLSTGLKPYVDLLDESSAVTFLETYKTQIESYYLTRLDGKVVLRFPRMFILAQRN
jgi:trans-aconitate 2-methyltransferase